MIETQIDIKLSSAFNPCFSSSDVPTNSLGVDKDKKKESF